MTRLTTKKTCCKRPIVQRYQSVFASLPSVSHFTKCSDKIMMNRWKMIKKIRFWSPNADSSFSSSFSTICKRKQKLTFSTYTIQFKFSSPHRLAFPLSYPSSSSLDFHHHPNPHLKMTQHHVLVFPLLRLSLR